MARKRPQIPSTAALGFQAGIGVVGLLAIFLFGIPVQYDGLSFGSVVLWGVAGSVATYVVIMMLTWLPGPTHPQCGCNSRCVGAVWHGALSFVHLLSIGDRVGSGVGSSVCTDGQPAAGNGLAWCLRHDCAVLSASVSGMVWGAGWINQKHIVCSSGWKSPIR